MTLRLLLILSFLPPGSATLLKSCHLTNCEFYCMWSVGTESVIVGTPMEGLTFTAKVCLHFSFTIIQNLFLSLCSLAAWQTSGQWGCIKCLTGGHLPRPQSWPSHHERIHYQTAPLNRWTAAPPDTICIKIRPTVQHDKPFPFHIFSITCTD